MLKKTKTIGSDAEEMAQNFLLQKGYSIIAKNYRYKRLEIDIIAEIDEVIVFVEVKFRKNSQYGEPERFVTEKKINNMMEAAEAYLSTHQKNGELRFDIISIMKENGKFQVEHFEDAFYHF